MYYNMAKRQVNEILALHRSIDANIIIYYTFLQSAS